MEEEKKLPRKNRNRKNLPENVSEKSGQQMKSKGI